MRIFASMLSLVVLSAPALAQPAPERVEIDMSSFKYMPSTVALRHGQAYMLHFVNHSSGGHDFTAPAFFAAAQVSAADRGTVGNGAVKLGGHQVADVHLIAPAAGRYSVHCGHFMHSTLGMKGTIVVQ